MELGQILQKCQTEKLNTVLLDKYFFLWKWAIVVLPENVLRLCESDTGCVFLTSLPFPNSASRPDIGRKNTARPVRGLHRRGLGRKVRKTGDPKREFHSLCRNYCKEDFLIRNEWPNESDVLKPNITKTRSSKQ